MEAFVHIAIQLNSFINKKQKQIEEIKQSAKATKNEIIRKILSILAKNTSSENVEIQDNYTEQKLIEEIEEIKKDLDLKTSSLQQSDKDNSNNYANELDQKWKEQENKIKDLEKEVTDIKKEKKQNQIYLQNQFFKIRL